MNIETLRSLNRKLKTWNDQYGEGESSKEIALKDRRMLNSISNEINRIDRARGTRTALGVFGQSQCGKSYLTSELIGGSDTRLIIDGKKSATFHDYNQNNADKESTALVTRFTSKSENYNAPPGSVMVRFLSPSEIMWSFVYGFYNELKWTNGFEINENQQNLIKENIKSNDNSNRMMKDIELLSDEFSECLTWINQNMKYPYALADIASDYFSSHEKISLEKYILLVSTLWNCDENLTKAFQSRIETLYNLNFSYEGSIPEQILKNALDASSLDRLSLEVSTNDLIQSQNGDLANGVLDETNIANIQAVIKEVCLLADVKDESLASEIDILDFPGARALTGLAGGLDSQEISESISNNSSILISNVFKRGKLSFLFDLYKKDFDLSLLIFCTQSGSTQEAKSLRKMLSSWVKMYKDDPSELDNPSLFVAFTKADLLIKNNATENSETANGRITARLKDNFQDSFGSWTKDYFRENNHFSNIYLTRSPIAGDSCFDLNNGSENWRAGFEEKKDLLRSVWLQNKIVNDHLGAKKELLFDNVFTPNKHGIDYLINKVREKFNSNPNKKENHLKQRANDIEKRMFSFIHKYSPNTNKQIVEEEQRKLAIKFINDVKKKYESVALVLNAIHDNCPEFSYLDSLISEASTTNSGGSPIQLGSPLKKAVPKFIENWFDKLTRHNSLSNDLKINKSDLESFFINIKNFILDEDTIFEIIDPFEDFDLLGNPSEVKALRNYLIWHVGEKVYYLGYVERNGTPQEPITIPDDLDFRDFILNTIWREQLPEIYAGNYEMRRPTDGTNKLIEIKGEFYS